METSGGHLVSDKDLVEAVQFLTKFVGVFHKQRVQHNPTSNLQSIPMRETIRQLNNVLQDLTNHREASDDDNSNILLQYIERTSKKGNRVRQNIKTGNVIQYSKPVNPLKLCHCELVSILPQKPDYEDNKLTANSDLILPPRNKVFSEAVVTTWGIPSEQKALKLPRTLTHGKIHSTEIEQNNTPDQGFHNVKGTGRKNKSPNLDQSNNECAEQNLDDPQNFLSSYNFGQCDSSRGFELPSGKLFSVLPNTAKTEKVPNKMCSHVENMNQPSPVKRKAANKTRIVDAEYETRSVNHMPGSAHIESPLTPPEMWNLHFS
ncbi:hypothetical protein XU18_0459 [Perkinsela sp. CCAP 1560/4]|nr:hypothetical protein XU18_0459 [Perkinsela sp. CCAP 1560/4]|eukprot:KNH09774.1 hypothetical protein XU18_0459 [Perkinsela sp. CCAP 1560/4]